MHASTFVGTILAVATIGSAAEYQLTNDGHMSLAGSLGMDFTGTLIGDWDEIDNPEGTQTLPGVWGGSGNTPIPVDLTVTISFDGDSNPEGPLDLVVDPKTSSATISGLHWEVLPETAIPASLTSTILYETFRTLAPDALYPGGVPIDIPMGEASVAEATLVQAGPGIGTAIPAEDEPGATDLLVPVPATLTFIVATESLGDLPMEFPVILNVEGRHRVENAASVLLMTVSAAFDEAGDIEGEPLPSIPLEMPTVIPPGDETAGVLLDLTPSAASAVLGIDSELTAVHEPDTVLGDVNGDGLVNTDDLLAVLAAWGPCDPPCSEDINGDGDVGVDDLLILIGNWSA